MAKPHSEWAWTKASRALKAECQRIDEPCHLCGKPIDYTAPPTSRWSFTADHIVTLSGGGALVPEPGGLRPAHRGCNSKRGDADRQAMPTSRHW